MRTTLILAGLIVVPWLAVAQTDSENVKKYWKLRSRFKEQFVKIGPAQGEGLPAAVLKPCECIDDLDANIDGNGWGETCYGEMHWGDGMIRQGHYLGLLATEYRLLKNEGKDVKGVLSELYFALNAIDRVDNSAEENQGTFYSAVFAPSLNGFYNREDIPQGFAKLHWGNDAMLMRGVNSSYYYNNYASDSDVNPGSITKFNEYQNTPSLDQLTSLMVGFSLVHKLVDNELVNPTGENPVYIRDYNAQIVDRLIRDIADHNWFMIDVNGWPVNNGGGDVVLAAFPLLAAAERITGNTYNENWKRRFIPYAAMQECITGYGTHEVSPENQQAACDKIQLNALLLQAAGPGVGMPGLMIEYNTSYTSLQNGVPAGSNNNHDNSKFQNWQLNGPLHGTTDFTIGIWLDKVPTEMPGANTVSKWEYILSNLAPPEWRLIQSWMGPITDNYDEHWIKDYNMTIMFNLGVASGYWSKGIAAIWGNSTGNKQLELINSILRDESPMNSRAHYKSYLDDLTIFGPYSFEGVSWPEPHSEFSFHEDGWASEYRWTHPQESLGPLGKKGIFSGMDYMLYHNLVQLAFPSEAVAMEEADFCTCYTAPQEPTFGVETPEEAQALQSLNQKLAFLGACQSDVLAEVNNEVYGNFVVGPKFPTYTTYGIQTTRYQTTDAVVKNGGVLTVNNRLVMCNSTITIEPSAEMVIKGEVDLKAATSMLDVYGTLRLNNNGRIDLGTLTKIILRGSAKLIIENDVDLDFFGASIEYYSGAEIISLGSNSKINFNPGGIILMDNATLKENLDNGQPVKLVFSGNSRIGTKDGVVGTFDFNGYWKGEPFIELKDNAVLWIQDDALPGNGTTKLKLTNCGVKFGTNSEFRIHENVSANNVIFQSENMSTGLNITDVNLFYSCDFKNVPIVAPLNIENKAPLKLVNCIVENNINVPGIPFLVHVTGQSYYVSNSDFISYNGQLIYSENGVSNSQISYSSFNRFNNSQYLAVGAVRDVSNKELFVNNSSFSNTKNGINKEFGKLTLKCNTFQNVLGSNVEMKNGILNLSVNSNGGYNNFGHPVSDLNNIKIDNVTLQMNNGYNKFGALTGSLQKYIYGSVSTPCQPNSDCSIMAMKNQWGNSTQIPSQNNFYVLGSNQAQFQIAATSTYLLPLCGSFDPPSNPGGGGSGKSAKNEDEQYPTPYITISDFDSITLQDAAYYGLSKMTLYNERGNDLEALQIFDEIFKNNISKDDPYVKELLRTIGGLMKSSLESAFSNNVLLVEENISSFNPFTQKYVDALNFLTDEFVDDENYNKQFLLELDKIQLFRLINKPIIAKELLEELEFCGLNQNEQLMVNHWKKQVEKDLIVLQNGFDVLDSIFSIDTSTYKKPKNDYNGWNSFGAKIVNANRIEYPSCDNIDYSNFINQNELYVYPNPGKNEFNVVIDLLDFGKSVKLTVETLDGKLMFTTELSMIENGVVEIDSRNYAMGTYLIKVIGKNNELKVGRFVKN